MGEQGAGSRGAGYSRGVQVSYDEWEGGPPPEGLGYVAEQPVSEAYRAIFDSDVWSILDEAGDLLISKHRDYGPKNISMSPGGPLNGIRVRLWDKIARINNLLDENQDPQHEGVRDSFIDAMNYCLIAIMCIDKTWPGVD